MIRYSIVLIAIVIPLNSEILLRSTFEHYEQEEDSTCGWFFSTGGIGAIDFKAEDKTNEYQTQAHGEWSLWIKDSDNTSYANASKSFSNDETEYMAEFYFWIYVSHVYSDTFPLCALFAPDSVIQTDIALYINEVNPAAEPPCICVYDAAGFHYDVATIDSVNRWYKVQIHRHDDSVNLYLDGDLCGTYVPFNSDCVSNKIIFGSTDIDAEADGEVFIDDVIVSTPPQGEHPCLLFDSTFLDTIWQRKNSSETTPLGISYRDVARYVRNDAYRYAGADDSIIVFGYVFYHPFPYPAQTCTSPDVNTWNFLCGQIKMRIVRLALAYIMTDSTEYRDTAREILGSIATWPQWVNPFHYHKLCNQYCFHATYNLAIGLALGYDWLYDSLSHYELMSLQNALLSLGIGQLYLESLKGIHGSNLDQSDTASWSNPDGGNWPNYYTNYNASLGLASLLLRDEFVANVDELDTARVRIGDLFDDYGICDSAGGYVEGIDYCGWSFQNLNLFCIADSVAGNSCLLNEPYWYKNALWRSYSRVPGNEIDYHWTHGKRELNFGDTYSGGIQDIKHRNGYILRLATKYSDQLLQYYSRYAKSAFNFEYLFWMDSNLDAVHPSGRLFGHFSPHIGWAIFRNGWRNNDYLIAMKSGRKVGHTQYDNNTIILGTRNRWLITDAGYGQSDITRFYPVNHNALVVNNDMAAPQTEDCTISRFYISADSTYGYCRGDAEIVYENLSRYTRDLLFINVSVPFFVLRDFVQPDSTVEDLTWLFHAWGGASWIDTTNTVRIVDCQLSDTEYVDIRIVLPLDLSYDDTLIKDTQGRDSTMDTTRTRIYLKRSLPDSPSESSMDCQFLAVLIPDHEQHPSVTAQTVTGDGLIGAQVADGLVMFGTETAGLDYGQYYVICGDSLLNIICDLWPGAQYEVKLQLVPEHGLPEEPDEPPDSSCLLQNSIHQECEMEMEEDGSMVRYLPDYLPQYDTVQANEAGIISFKLRRAGEWRVTLTAINAPCGPQSQDGVASTKFLFEVYPTICSRSVNIRMQGIDCLEENASLYIYDISGRLVKRFTLPRADASQPVVLSWDGYDSQSRQVANGVYFVRLAMPNHKHIKKVVFLR